MMERKQPEWIRRFGATMRAERASCVYDPLPKAIVAKLQALKDIEQRQRADCKRSSGSSPRNDK
jgi:hypothetical protein